MTSPEIAGHLELDFLPVKFREENSQRNARAWRSVVLVALAVLVLAAIGLQQRNRLALRAEAEALAPLFEESQSRTAEFKSLQTELEAAAHRAEVATYLCHPWPRTQVLKVLLEPLPTTVLLTEVAISLEAADGLPRQPAVDTSNAAKDGKSDKQASKLDEAQFDLKRLREEYDGRLLVISLSGHAGDLEQLYSYLSQVGIHELVLKAELRSLESAGQLGIGSKFNARVVVRPSYGQPSGPKTAPTPPNPDKIARGW